MGKHGRGWFGEFILLTRKRDSLWQIMDDSPESPNFLPPNFPTIGIYNSYARCMQLYVCMAILAIILTIVPGSSNRFAC